jgi:DNA-binding YbaB/EbfC family protein
VSDNPAVDRLMEQVYEQQRRVMEVQRTVERTEVKGRSRENEVEVTVRGSGEFTEISIDQRAMTRYDADTLGQVVLEAVNDGLRKVNEMSAAKFAPIIDAAGAAGSTDAA